MRKTNRKNELKMIKFLGKKMASSIVNFVANFAFIPAG